MCGSNAVYVNTVMIRLRLGIKVGRNQPQTSCVKSP
jgi:hypothetical protein